MNNILTSTAQPVTLRIPDFKRVYLTLVGCGGTGSHLVSGLAAIAQALIERSIAIDLFFLDSDRVEPKNIGRQLFSAADLGQRKAEVLAERINGAFGLRVMCAARTIDMLDLITQPEQRDALHLVIGAVDNPAARGLMANGVKEAAGRLWWLDCGNENHSGQVCIGNVAQKSAMRGAIALGMVDRVPSPSVVWPDLVKAPTPALPRRGKARDRGGRTPSCAELTAAGEQSLMINRMVAGWACSMLHDFLVTRDLRYFSVAIDLQWGGVQALTIDAPTIARVCGLGVDEVLVKGAEHGKARATQNH